MAQRPGLRPWLSRNIVIGCLVVCLALHVWITSIAVQPQQDRPSCEAQRDTLFQTMQLLNNRLILQEGNNIHEGTTMPVVPELKEKPCECGDGGSNPASCSRPGVVDTEATRVLGKARGTKGFLTIGIPTVKRDKNSHYLGITLNSLLEHTTEPERHQVTVVIFLADFDTDYNKKLSLEIHRNYSQHLDDGFMQVVQAPKSFYPNLEGLKQNFKDSQERVKWRSKQCVDFAFLFSYCRELSDFYLQLEDDVISSEKYVPTIAGFINAQDNPWAMLEFSELGFIGKLLRSSDLQRLADFLMLFYDEMPNDFLIRHFVRLLPHKDSYVHRPSLFQHIGKHSSLAGKVQKLVDKYFVGNAKGKYNSSDNPPAVVSTNMFIFNQFKPQLAYSREAGYFWAEQPKVGQAFFILFNITVRLSRIVIETGSEDHPKDIIESGTLEASPHLLSINKVDNTPECSHYAKLADFDNGRLDMATESKEGLGSLEVKCLKVTLTSEQKVWILVREIAVWTVK